ncbi:MAG: molybdate ABC transporter permease subunit [Lachnospiraceae bacterium]|nr:molybdate ABC transporter permease subunit [Lachnospiraceae bacterium]
MDFAPIIISLKIAIVSTAVTFFIGMYAAWKTANMIHGKGILDAVFTLPMVLPPTVTGFFLLVFFGKSSAIGAFLSKYDFDFVFSWRGAVLASIVVTFPLMYRTTRSAFEQLNPNLIDAGRTLGLSGFKIFWKIVFPNCLPGILGATILSFSRALGEFGATIMIAGNIPGKTQTASLAVYTAMQAGNRPLAYQWVMVLMLISFAAMLAMNAVNGRQELLVRKGGGR